MKNACVRRFFRYYPVARLHLSLEKDSPDPRSVQPVGEIIVIPQVGGLHHLYERHAA
jgi:putative transposase